MPVKGMRVQVPPRTQIQVSELRLSFIRYCYASKTAAHDREGLTPSLTHSYVHTCVITFAGPERAWAATGMQDSRHTVDRNASTPTGRPSAFTVNSRLTAADPPWMTRVAAMLLGSQRSPSSSRWSA